MAEKERFCARDDIPVRKIRDGMSEKLRTVGTGPPSDGYYHVGNGANCGRQFLTEQETYTEGASDGNPPSSEY